MEFSVKSSSVENNACVFSGGCFRTASFICIGLKRLDNISAGYISALLRRSDEEGKVGQTLLLHHVPNIPARSHFIGRLR